MNIVDKMMAWETGQMSPDEVIEFFQELVSSGAAWELQGAYGRQAARLIEGGWVRTP